MPNSSEENRKKAPISLVVDPDQITPNVIFIDDVLNTGTHVRRFLQFLTEAGAKRIEPFTLFRLKAPSPDFEDLLNRRAFELEGIQAYARVLNDPHSIYSSRLITFIYQLNFEQYRQLISQLSPHALLNLYVYSLELLRVKDPQYADILVHAIEKKLEIILPDSHALRRPSQEDLIYEAKHLLLPKYKIPITAKTDVLNRIKLVTSVGMESKLNENLIEDKSADYRRAEVREIATEPSQLSISASNGNLPAIIAKSQDIPASLFFAYDEIKEKDSILRRGLLALASLTQGSELKLVIYNAERTDLGLKEFRDLGVEVTQEGLSNAFGTFGEKSNGRNVNVSTKADLLRKELSLLSGLRLKHLLVQDESEIWAAYLRAITDPDQVIPGLDDSQGYYQVVGEFLRSELRRYQASLVIAMAA